MLPEKLKQLFRELGYEIYLDREGNIRVKETYAPYGLDRHDAVAKLCYTENGTEMLKVKFMMTPSPYSNKIAVKEFCIIDREKGKEITG